MPLTGICFALTLPAIGVPFEPPKAERTDETSASRICSCWSRHDHGTANATPVTTLDTLTIWNALTPGATVTSASQQALPATNPLFTAANLISTPPNTAAGEINFSLLSGTPTVGAFLATDNPALTVNPCGAACSATAISQGGFAQTSLMRFNFTIGSTSTFNVSHDDGVALFTAGTTATASDLFARRGFEPHDLRDH